MRYERGYDMLKAKANIIEKWQKDKRRKIADVDKLSFCPGCRRHWYNRNKKGGCWHLKKAKLKEREIYTSLHSKAPTAVVTLGCYIQEYR